MNCPHQGSSVEAANLLLPLLAVIDTFVLQTLSRTAQVRCWRCRWALRC
jgi:hypothetical protein